MVLHQLLQDWLKQLSALFHPIRSKTKVNLSSFALVFPSFTTAPCYYFEFDKFTVIFMRVPTTVLATVITLVLVLLIDNRYDSTYYFKRFWLHVTVPLYFPCFQSSATLWKVMVAKKKML